MYAIHAIYLTHFMNLIVTAAAAAAVDTIKVAQKQNCYVEKIHLEYLCIHIDIDDMR